MNGHLLVDEITPAIELTVNNKLTVAGNISAQNIDAEDITITGTSLIESGSSPETSGASKIKAHGTFGETESPTVQEALDYMAQTISEMKTEMEAQSIGHIPIGGIIPWHKSISAMAAAPIEEGTANTVKENYLVNTGSQDWTGLVQAGDIVRNNDTGIFSTVTEVTAHELKLDINAFPAGTESYSIYKEPTLFNTFAECNGQVLTDTESPLNGLTVPDLNSEVYSGSRGYYLRGGKESGNFNESTYWTDNGNAYHGNNSYYYGACYAQLGELDADSSDQITYASGSRLGNSRRFQTAAMTAVWIIRIK